MSSSRASSMVVRAPRIWAIPPAIVLRVFRNASPRRPSRLPRAGASRAESFRRKRINGRKSLAEPPGTTSSRSISNARPRPRVPGAVFSSMNRSGEAR